MDPGPLVSQKIDAGARFLSEFEKYAPVQAAFWLKESDVGQWSLYVASDQITDDNFDVAYREVVRIVRQSQDPWFDAFQIKVLGVDHPLAKAVLDDQKRFPGRRPAWYHARQLGNVGVEEIYIYALPAAVAS